MSDRDGHAAQKLLHSAGTETMYNLVLPKASIFTFHLLLPQARTQLFKMDMKTSAAASSVLFVSLKWHKPNINRNRKILLSVLHFTASIKINENEI